MSKFLIDDTPVLVRVIREHTPLHEMVLITIYETIWRPCHSFITLLPLLCGKATSRASLYRGPKQRNFLCVCPNSSVFYTPVWKTGRIMPWQCPSVRLSVRLSVRPSVRPRFPDFSSTCFEISIWNLVYTFSRWHDMSSLSCITIGSLWPSLQPKVGQTYFLQSWPHKWR